MAPAPYSDIGRRAKDLLTKDYNFDQKFTLTLTSDTGLGLTASGVERDHYFVGNLSTQYRSRNTTVNVKIDTDSNISTTVMVNEILSHTQAAISFNVPDHKSGKLYVHYRHPHAIINSRIGLTPTPFLEIAAAIGSKELCLGGEIGFDTATASVTKCNAGIGLNKPDFSAALMLVDKGEALKASYIHEVNPINRATVAAEMTHRLSTNENSFTIGSSYGLNPGTVIKTRFSDDGKVAMACQQEWRRNSLLTFSAEYDSKNTRFFLSQIIELDANPAAVNSSKPVYV